jgi:hypothetical protein
MKGLRYFYVSFAFLSVFIIAEKVNEFNDHNDHLDYQSKPANNNSLYNFEQWATEQGILHSNLVINNSNGEYSVLSKQDIQVHLAHSSSNLFQPGDMILEIPIQVLLSQYTHPPALLSIFAKYSNLIHGKNKMALRLLYEKHSNPSSFWKPYIGNAQSHSNNTQTYYLHLSTCQCFGT